MPQAKSEQPADVTSLPYARLQDTHEDFDLEYMDELYALYAGGRDLLRNSPILHRLFPEHAYEDAQVYAERCRRAHYTNHAGAIVDYPLASLTADPASLEAGEDEEFWSEFTQDCSRPGGEAMDVNQLGVKHLRQALIFGRAWTLIDLPAKDGEYSSRADQEADGALDAYAQPLDSRCVRDWKISADGEVEWALLRFVSLERVSMARPRVRVVERYYLYDRSGWTEFVVQYDDPKLCDKYKVKVELKKPADKDAIPGTWNPYEHGRVPIVHTEIDESLWMMNKLHSPAREYFNRESAYGWALAKACFPILYEFLQPSAPGIDQPINEHAEDMSRANRPPRIGYKEVRAQDDDAKFVSPSSEPFEHVQKSLNNLKDEIHRIVYQMSLATDNSAAALQRSGASKAQDKASATVLVVKFAEIVRGFLRRVVVMAARLRAPARPEDIKVTVRGMRKFDDVALSDMVEEIVALGGVDIPSATFWHKLLTMLAHRMVGHECSADELGQIVKELEKSITQDSLMRPDPVIVPPANGENRDEPEDSKALPKGGGKGENPGQNG